MAEVRAGPRAAHAPRESMKQCPDSAPLRRRHSMEQIDG